MSMRWSLNELYPSFDSEELASDLKKCDTKIKEINLYAESNLHSKNNAKEKIESYIALQNEFGDLFSRLYDYASLTLSVDTKNKKALGVVEKLESKMPDLTGSRILFERWLSSIDNLPEIINSSELLKQHEFYLNELVNNSKYILSEKEEVLLSKMTNTGSKAWSKLQDYLTSTLSVDININGKDEKVTLPVVRNMAYSDDKCLRKTAYEAELKSYDKIAASSAACLNGIKGEVITVSNMRGYKSPLEKTLIDSRLDSSILDAMLSAIRERLPFIRKYFKKKAEILGYKNGLPFYELFAPVGKAKITFTYDEAKDFIIKNFATFSCELSKFAENAFDKRWIDAEPREGKVGGAFCENLHSIGESRIMSNFTGSFNDMVSLAHELGHGFHGLMLKDKTYLNSDYPMPIAETASTFCETIVTNAALMEASRDEAVVILENSLLGSCQSIVDIYSRFLFESELFERRKEGSVSVDDLNSIMLKAQIEAYGDGLDKNYLHPYMWACKPHYYYADYNFYNFPYAFGELFTKGLYAQYLKKGSSFVEDYKKMLSLTSTMNISDVAGTMGIDLHAKDFFLSSLKVLEDEIDKFISLV